MKRRLMLLNVVLLVLTGVLVWRYRVIWLEARDRERRVLNLKTPAEKAGSLPALAEYTPATAINYMDVVQKMLFSKDRNSDVIIEATPPPVVEPMPALPGFYGLMTGFGDPGIILSERPGAAQKIYRAGDVVGAFKLVEFSNTKITLLWKEETVERRLDELIVHVTQQAAAAPTQNTASAPAAAQTTSIAPQALGPGTDIGGGYRSCQPNDSTASGTVQNGVRKTVKSNPFGTSCMWEPVR